MSSLNPLLTKVFRGPLDLNGPVLGRLFFLFEYARCLLEQRVDPFDARFATDTSAPTFERGQKTSVHFYVPTTASLIYEVLRLLPLDRGRYSFVDMGSGKGRALLVASEFPFAKIVGIELSAHLHRIAEENVKRFRPATQQCTKIELHCMDALDYVYDDKPLVLFLFDPFGRDVLKRVLDTLEASLRAAPRDAYVVYVYPQFEDLLRGSSLLHPVTVGGPRWRPWSRYAIYATAGVLGRLGQNETGLPRAGVREGQAASARTAADPRSVPA
jgi:SAM-dependent methyltransferase